MDRTKYLSLEEVRQLRDCAELACRRDLETGRKSGPIAWMLVDLALSTGLRVSELARIKVADVDLKRSILTVCRSKKREKTGRMVRDVKTRKRKPEYRRKLTDESLNIGSDLGKHLREYLEWRKLADIDNENLLIGKRGPLTPQGLELIWRKTVAAAGLPAEYSIHCARHTMAVVLLKKTGNLRQVQKQLGHSSPIVTANMYADITDEDMKAGVENLYD